MTNTNGGAVHAPPGHRPAPVGQEQVDRQPRALPAPLPRADQGRGAQGGGRPQHPRHRGRRRHHAAQARRVRAGLRPRPRRQPRDWCTRATRNTCAATASSGPQGGGGGGRRQRRLAGRAGRGRLRLPHHARRVHELLLRRPGAAAPDPHAAAGRRAGVEDAPRRLRLRRQPDQPARGALDARGPGAPHRHGRRRARRAASGRGAPASSSKRATDTPPPRSTRCKAEIEELRERLKRVPFLDPSTCATATACASRCPPARP